MTLLLVLAGQPATGILKKAPDMSKYKHLSPELRAKLEAKLTAEHGSGTDTANWAEENVRTEVPPSLQRHCLHIFGEREVAHLWVYATRGPPNYVLRWAVITRDSSACLCWSPYPESGRPM